jgi:threonine synthase
MAAAWADDSETIRPRHIVNRPTGIAEAILRGDPSRPYPHVRRIVLDSRGTFAVVTEAEILAARSKLHQLEGIRGCNAAAAALAGLAQLARSGVIAADETILVNVTGGVRADAAPAAGTVRLRRRRDHGDWQYGAEPAA